MTQLPKCTRSDWVQNRTSRCGLLGPLGVNLASISGVNRACIGCVVRDVGEASVSEVLDEDPYLGRCRIE